MRTSFVSIFLGVLIVASPALAARDRSIERPPSSVRTEEVPQKSDEVRVKSPGGGESMLLGGARLAIVFTTPVVDPSLNGKYLMMAELMKDGKTLGPAHSLSVPLFAKPNVQTQNIVIAPGKYASGSSLVNAAEGTGYQYRISLYTGDWGNAPLVFATGLSGTFTLGVITRQADNPVVTVTRPATGVSLFLNAKGESVVFQVKNADASRDGRLKYIVELVRNGSNLGYAHDPDVSLLAKADGTNNRLAVVIGSYIESNPRALRKAVPGSTYQYRVTVYTGDWKKSPRIVASGLSGAFTIKRPRTVR